MHEAIGIGDNVDLASINAINCALKRQKIGN